MGIEIGVSVEYLDYFKSEFRFFKVVNKCQREVSQYLVLLVAFLSPLREHLYNVIAPYKKQASSLG